MLDFSVAGSHDAGMSLVSAIVTLFLVMDPLGNIPAFLGILGRVPPERQFRVNLRENLIALAILLVFLFAGPAMLQALHIRQPALQISGGILLFIIALGMIFSYKPIRRGGEEDDEPFIVPLATPLIAGPSAMATITIFASDAPARIWEWLIALLCAWAASAVILLAATRLSRILGRRGLVACERLMGMILTIVAVQMFLDGLGAFLQSPG